MENNTQVGATTPETNGLDTQPKVNNAPSIDYEQEFKKQSLEIERLKNAISKVNSENADYKRKELEKMTDDEKRAKEYQDLMDSNAKLAEELKQFQLKDELLQNGFTAQESDMLIKTNMSVKTFADILKTRIDEAVKSAKAEQIKNSTPKSPIGSGTTNDSQESLAKKLAEKNHAVDTSKIKNYYNSIKKER